MQKEFPIDMTEAGTYRYSYTKIKPTPIFPTYFSHKHTQENVLNKSYTSYIVAKYHYVYTLYITNKCNATFLLKFVKALPFRINGVSENDRRDFHKILFSKTKTIHNLRKRAV